MNKHLLAPEPPQMFPNGTQVLYRRTDGRMGGGTVLSYNRETGQFKIQTKNCGIVSRFWAGVRIG